MGLYNILITFRETFEVKLTRGDFLPLASWSNSLKRPGYNIWGLLVLKKRQAKEDIIKVFKVMHGAEKVERDDFRVCCSRNLSFVKDETLTELRNP